MLSSKLSPLTLLRKSCIRACGVRVVKIISRTAGGIFVLAFTLTAELHGFYYVYMAHKSRSTTFAVCSRRDCRTPCSV